MSFNFDSVIILKNIHNIEFNHLIDSMTFHSLLKPFKWPYPIIFNLPESLLPLLASPIPIIFGFI